MTTAMLIAAEVTIAVSNTVIRVKQCPHPGADFRLEVDSAGGSVRLDLTGLQLRMLGEALAKTPAFPFAEGV